MWIVRDKRGKFYAGGHDMSGWAIHNAVMKYEPTVSKKRRRWTWLQMVARGFKLTNEQAKPPALKRTGGEVGK